MLQQLYQQLAELYELEAPHTIADFLITDRDLVGTLQQASPAHAREQLLIRQHRRQLDVALFLDASVIENLKPENVFSQLNCDEINDYWLAVEGVSHFLYLTWRSCYDRPMTELEMELQAEIDKYLCSSLALPENRRDLLLSQLHHVLFEQTTIDTTQNSERTERYRTANYYAARYCYALRSRLQHGIPPDLTNELRRFYRLSQNEKIRHIQSMH